MVSNIIQRDDLYSTPNNNIFKTKKKMSRRRNGVKKDRVAKLDEINAIDRKMKRKKSEDELNRLKSRRVVLMNQLKTK